MPVGNAVALFCDHLAEILHPFEVVGDVFESLLGGASFELSRNLLGCPFAGGGAEQVADGDELFFGLGRPLLRFDGDNDDFLGGTHTFEDGLDGLCLLGGLVFGAQPADVAVAFFFGALGVEGNEAFEGLLVGDGVWPAVGIENGGV